VKRVVYPGLPSHPQYELAMRQQHGFGAMITFFCNGGREEAAVFLQNVRLRMCIRGPELYLNYFNLCLFSRFSWCIYSFSLWSNSYTSLRWRNH
jgi:hypothetical protein